MTVPDRIERMHLGFLRQCQHLELYDVEMLLTVAESGRFRKAG